MRVPAGVRVDGRGVGGRFVSASSLAALSARVDDDASYFAILDALADEADRRARQLEKLQRKFYDDPKKYARAVDDAESAVVEIDTALDDVASNIPGVDREAFDMEAREFDQGYDEGYDEPLDDYEAEWEIGFEYRSGSGGGGRHKNVDVNIRIRRDDGRAFGPHEAVTALRAFVANVAKGETNPVPRGYELAGIDWRRPGRRGSGASGGFSGGGEPDYAALTHFFSPMYTRKDDESAWTIGPPGIRLGGVKP